MRIYLSNNVYEESLERIRFIFDEFETVIVNFSGGKDSTVIFHLAMQVAKERNRLPLKVLFLDQEAEYQNTIDYVKTVMYHKDVEPLWFQVPIRLFNATSHKDAWLMCWDEGEEWLREKDAISIKENISGTDRFMEFFPKIVDAMFPDGNVAKLGGVRTEESPARLMGLTNAVTYKYVTWGKIENKAKKSYTFYPIYDWSYTDVWKAIHDNKWPYCKIYDYQYRYGTPVKNMRVSNLHHESALKNLELLQEVEPETWNKLAKRLKGINTYKHTGKMNYAPKELPRMFTSWREYRDFLLSHLTKPEYREKFQAIFDRMDNTYKEVAEVSGLYKVCVKAIIINDYHSVKLGNFEKNADVIAFRNYKKIGERNRHGYNKLIDHYVKHFERPDKRELPVVSR